MSDGNHPADLPLPENTIQAAEDVITSWRHSPVAYPSSLARTVLVAVADDLRAQGAAAERAEAEADLADLRARLKATSDACNQARNELVAARTEGVAARTEGAAAERELAGQLIPGHTQNVRVVHSVLNSCRIQLMCYGIHKLRLSGGTPDDSEWMTWDDKNITTEQLIGLLRFDLNPDAPKRALEHRHHKYTPPPQDALFGGVIPDGS